MSRCGCFYARAVYLIRLFFREGGYIVMATILLSEYAARNGRAVNSVRQMAKRGSFQTAKKIGWQWFIEEDEEYPDLRVTSGKYIGLSSRQRGRKNKTNTAAIGETSTRPAGKGPSEGE